MCDSFIVYSAFVLDTSNTCLRGTKHYIHEIFENSIVKTRDELAYRVPTILYNKRFYAISATTGQYKNYPI